MLNEMGINVIESEEQDEREAKSRPRSRQAQAVVAKTGEEEEQYDRTDDPVRMYLREMGSVELLSARRRNRHREAHRSGPRIDDRRALRKPAHV